MAAVKEGKLVVISGMPRSGKTTIIRRLHDRLKFEEDIIVSKSYAVEKHRVTLSTLFMALYLDISDEEIDKVKIHRDNEKNTKKLIRLIQDKGKNVVLLIDDAHAIQSQTLIDLKKLMETINSTISKAQLKFSVVLAGRKFKKLF